MNTQNVFYADDDEDDLFLFQEALNEIQSQLDMPVSLHLIKNGVQLLGSVAQIKDARPIILLDINMPFKSGIEHLKDIRQNSDVSSAVVIIYSTSDDEGTISKSFHGGASYYVSKPGDFNSLKAMIRTILTKDWDVWSPNMSNFVYSEQSSFSSQDNRI